MIKAFFSHLHIRFCSAFGSDLIMASGGDSGAAARSANTDDLVQAIQNLNKGLLDRSDGQVGAVYRCSTCGRLATQHTDSNVKYCKKKKIGMKEWVKELVHQHNQLSNISVAIDQDALTTLNQLRNRLELMRTMLDQKEKKAERQRQQLE